MSQANVDALVFMLFLCVTPLCWALIWAFIVWVKKRLDI